MKIKQLYFVATLSFLIIPSIALASWWNPFTWFKKKVVPQPVEQVVVQQPVLPPQPIAEVPDIEVITPEYGGTMTTNTPKKSVTPSVVAPFKSQGTDYRNQLVGAYVEKMRFLDNKVANWEIMQSLIQSDIDDNEDMIAGSEAYQSVYRNDSDLVKLAEVGIRIWKMENEEDKKYIAYYDGIIASAKSSRKQLSDDAATLANRFVSEQEYSSKKMELDQVVDEDDITTKMAANTDSIFDYRRARIAKAEAFIKFNAQRFVNNLATDTAALKAQASIPATPAVVTVRVPQPSQIRCISERMGLGMSSYVQTSCNPY